ncbi:MAG: hypothetical protein LC790_14925 [Actinobacteria bacterium]|nr:hypothetical protein [Actinomycetota bacterium]
MSDAQRVRGALHLDGAVRTYSIFVPTSSNARYDGVAFILHGGGSRESGERIAGAVGFDAYAQQHNWIAVNPDARGGRFHGGHCCGNHPARADDRAPRQATARARTPPL